MSKLPRKIKNALREEAEEWDLSIAREDPEQVRELLDKAEPFVARRPAF